MKINITNSVPMSLNAWKCWVTHRSMSALEDWGREWGGKSLAFLLHRCALTWVNSWNHCYSRISASACIGTYCCKGSDGLLTCSFSVVNCKDKQTDAIKNVQFFMLTFFSCYLFVFTELQFFRHLSYKLLQDSQWTADQRGFCISRR